MKRRYEHSKRFRFNILRTSFIRYLTFLVRDPQSEEDAVVLRPPPFDDHIHVSRMLVVLVAREQINLVALVLNRVAIEVIFLLITKIVVVSIDYRAIGAVMSTQELLVQNRA